MTDLFKVKEICFKDEINLNISGKNKNKKLNPSDNWTYGSLECYDLNGNCSKCSNRFVCSNPDINMGKSPQMRKTVDRLLKAIGEPSLVTRRLVMEGGALDDSENIA